MIGPSFYITPPTRVIYNPVSFLNASQVRTIDAESDLSCWTAFRAGVYTFPAEFKLMSEEARYAISTRASVTVTYIESNCTAFKNTTRSLTLEDEQLPMPYGLTFHAGNKTSGCQNGQMVVCELGGDVEQNCKLNVRIQAALILAGCLVIKAAYMIWLNIAARKKVKTRLLTYGDVIVASAVNSTLRIWNECMVNTGEGHRHKVAHQCHKHCTDKEPSTTGDNLGHCQMCKKFNDTNHAADLVHPVMAIKYKSSLISNLGVTAVSQMMILMICTLAMLAVSIMLAVTVSAGVNSYHYTCSRYPNDPICKMSISQYVNSQYGGFGGFNSSVTLTALPADSLGSEVIAYSIANGAQFLYSLLYLLLIYNLTLITMEYDWGQLEKRRQRLRCTIVRGSAFEESYFLQLRKRVVFSAMGFSALMHWMLGQAISTIETTWSDPISNTAHSQNSVRSSTLNLKGILLICCT